MIRYSVQAELYFSSLSAAQSYANDLNTYFDATDDARVPFRAYPHTAPELPGTHVCDGEVRFSTKAKQSQVEQRIQSRWNSGPTSSRPLSGSFVWLHECWDDENQGCPAPTVLVKA